LEAFEITDEKAFWTFIVKELIVASTARGPAVLASGYFVYMSVGVGRTPGEAPTRMLTKEIALTPPDAPVTLNVSALLADNFSVMDLSVRQIETALIKLFKTPFQAVPAAPTGINWNRIPPSQRRKLEMAARARQQQT